MTVKRNPIRVNLIANRAFRSKEASAQPAQKDTIVADRPRAGVPDFRSLDILLRLTLLVALGALFVALNRVSLAEAPREFARLVGATMPVLFLTVSVLGLAARWVTRWPVQWVVGLSLALVTLFTLLAHFVGNTDAELPISQLLIAWIGSGVLWGFLALETRAKSPAFDIARLQALQARIRPHFLFNSLNAVASMVRGEPRKAETALLDLADLYRALMKDNRELTYLGEEVTLATQYLALEKMRLAERLRIKWFIDNMPGDALVPPLLLQPLLENAVYHGIEPAPNGGDITINIFARREQLTMVVSNPFLGNNNTRRSKGNNMAVGNIRERLKLHFDLEGTMQQTIRGNVYEVRVTMPYRRAPKVTTALTRRNQ
jgi:two-component system, LytTR family, sensor histidine kinase AlgZ